MMVAPSVSATPASTPETDLKALYGDQWKNRAEYIMFRIAKQVADLTPELTARGRAPLKLSIGAPTLPPPAGVQKALVDSLSEPGIHMYSTTRGELFFREAVAQRMQTRFGVSVDAKTEVISVIGSKEGLANFFRGLITPRPNPADQDVILIPDPGYASYVDSIHGAGGRSYPIPLLPQDQYCPDLNQVWGRLQQDGVQPHRVKAVVVNYPSNPLGATATLDYYQHVVDFARQHNLVVISDNAYADMYFDEAIKPPSILQVPGAMERCIEFHSLSKPYCLTGWRIGFAVGPKPLVDLLALVKGTMDSGLFRGIQKAGAYALTHPEADEHIAMVNQVYARNQQLFMDGLRELGWPVDQMNPPKATFYFWLPIPPRYSSCEQFAQDLLEKSGVVVVPGTGFGQFGEGYVRLSLVLSEADQAEVLRRMQEDGFCYAG